MADLIALPAELLLQILLSLPPSSLVSVCRSSKVLQHFAEPLLYKSIELDFCSEYDGRGIPKPILEHHPIHSFFCGLYRRPALAGYVKTVELCSEVTPWMASVPNIPAPPSIKPLWIDALRVLSLPQGETATFVAEIDRGNAGVFIGLLLASLHSIEVLATDYTMLRKSDLPHIVFQSNLGARSSRNTPGSHQGSRFPKLKEATIRNNVDSRIIKHNPNPHLSSIFCLQSLEHVTTILQGSDDMPWEKPGVTSQGNLPNLRTLQLTNHLSSSWAIGTLLANAPRLERLDYFLVEDTDDLAQDEDYQATHTDEWQAFSAALLTVAESLKSLRITIDEAATSDYPPETMDAEWMEGISARRGPIGSLRGLGNLTKLEIPMYILFGRYPHIVKLRDVLPPRLRKLHLRDDHIYDVDLDNCDSERVVELLRDYLLGHHHVDAAEKLPLEELRINLRGLHSRFDAQALEIISQEAGIKCTMHLRQRSFMSTQGRCVDVVEELTIYDPSTISSDGNMEHTVVGNTRYPTRYIQKEAGCFESNV